MFSVHTKPQSRGFQKLRIEERFRKVLFSVLISVDGRPVHGNKLLRFQIPPVQCGRRLRHRLFYVTF